MDDKLLVSQLQAHCSQLRGDSMTLGMGQRGKGRRKVWDSFVTLSLSVKKMTGIIWNSSGKEEERALLWVLMKES